MFQRGICVFLTVLLALGVVASVSGCKKSSHKENSTLKLTFLGQGSEDPKEGVVVALYEKDNNEEIEEIVVSDSNGVANFGGIGRTTASYTWAYQFTDGGATERRIVTLIEGPVLNEIIYIDEDFDDDEDPVLINVKATNVPDDALGVGLQVGGDFDRSASQALDGTRDTVEFTNVPIFNDNKNDDGKLTFLVLAFDDDGDIIRYGYLAGQTLDEGETYTVDLNRDPEAFSWTSTDPVEFVGIGFIYKDSFYNVGGEDYDRARSASSGDFNYAKQMLLNRALVYAQTPEITSASGGTEKEIRYTYGSRPTSVKFEIPDYEFSDTQFDNNTWSWDLDGTSPKDAIQWEFWQSSGAVFVEWEINVSPTRTSFVVPDLPDAGVVEPTWFNWGSAFGRDLGVEDTSNASGFKDFIRKVVDDDNSDTTFQETGTWRSGDYVFPVRAGETTEKRPENKHRHFSLSR